MSTAINTQQMFNRAFSLTFSRSKVLFTFFVLLLCGLLVVFCRALAIFASSWVVMSLTFLPIFLGSGILLSTGIILIRLYHDEVKGKPASVWGVVDKSWHLIIGASYFCIPLILAYLTLWVLLGVFVLLGQIPDIGELFGVILAFAPFLLNFASIVLCVLSLALLFFLTPAIALRGLTRQTLSQSLLNRLKTNLFSHLRLALIAVAPALFLATLLVLSAWLTGSFYVASDSTSKIVLQWFFMMIPFTALLSPVVVFFFNFAAETHVALKRSS